MAAASVAASATERDAAVNADTDALTLTNTEVDRVPPMSMFSNSEPLSMESVRPHGGRERRRVGYRDAAVNRHTHTDTLALTNTQVDRLLPMSIFSNSEPL